MKVDKFFEYSNKITQAGEYLLDHGFNKSFVVQASQAFLSLMMTESRIIRECRKQAWDTVMSCFNEYGKEMILKGIQYKEANLTDKQLIEIANKHNTTPKLFNNVWCDSLMASCLTLGAIGYLIEKGELK